MVQPLQLCCLRSLITGDPGAPAAGGGTAVVSERPEVRVAALGGFPQS
jgi:hypothetical protein